MFSREESKKIRQEFWTEFGKLYPRKWLLYNTSIKDLNLKFTFDTKIAMVSLNIEDKDEFIRSYYFDKLLSLKVILTQNYIPNIILEPRFFLENGKEISSIYTVLDQVNIHNKSTWKETMDFLYENMSLLEQFFLEYKEFIKS